MPHTSFCRSCGAEILWCVTTGGKEMPIDAQQTEDGNLRLEKGEKGEVLVHYSQVNLFGEETGGWISHFATCKQASKWRTG